MSLMGYEEKDVDDMVNTIHDVIVHFTFNPIVHGLGYNPTVEGLIKIQDFLEGLLEEGRV